MLFVSNIEDSDENDKVVFIYEDEVIDENRIKDS